MATATSRISVEIPPLPNPHPVRVGERLSGESGRGSPAPRISRRTAVPFLLEAFPAPPSHIPGTPTTVSPTSLLNGPSLLASVSARPCTSPVSPTSPSNPPPSSPPTGPLPPIPGPSSVTPFVARTIEPRPAHRPRLSLDANNPVRRARQGSLSSLRNPIYPPAHRRDPVAEVPAPALATLNHPPADDSIASVDLNALKSDNEPDPDDLASRPSPPFPPLPRSLPRSPFVPPNGHAPRNPSTSSVHVASPSDDTSATHRAVSPEITHIISATPRPRKRSTNSHSRDSSSTRHSKDSSSTRWAGDAPLLPSASHTAKLPASRAPAGLTEDDTAHGVAREDVADESDSSLDLLDLHTPLPQLMLRQGMLSPHSKLLPQPDVDSARLSIISSSSYLSNTSSVSLMSAASNSSKHPKDARDTLRRRVRHRDGKLLKGGIGLTTGLGWSDSEDEDAPSPLTRRVSTLILSRRASSSSIASCRTTRSQPNPIARSVSHSILRQVDEHENEHVPDEFGYAHRSIMATRSLPSRSNPVSRVASIRSIGSTLRCATSASGLRSRAGSTSASGISVASKSDNLSSSEASTLMPGIREQDDGVTPTRASFGRSSLGSSNGASAADFPHTPTSTASTVSLPFPATPESAEEIPPLQTYNPDKILPPLPPGVKGKYPSSLGLRSQSGGLQRPRTYSNASSVSNSSMLGMTSRDAKSSTASSTSTPRPSLADRSAKIGAPAGSPRPPLKGSAPRPSLTIPNSPLPPSAASGLPRPTTPSLSPSVSDGPGYTPRPLRLVSRGSRVPSPVSPANATPHSIDNQAEQNQSLNKALQPGEQIPRPGQVLTYNRNLHDQLKLRTISLNTGPNRTQVPVVSPGGAQTLFMPPPVAGSQPNSPLVSTPMTGRSQSPMSCPSPGVEVARPRPRTGTGMTYRTNLSVAPAAPSRIRVPSTVSR